MQLTDLFSVALAAATIDAAPVAKSWQDSVNQAVGDANNAVHIGVRQAQSGAQPGVALRGLGVANAGPGWGGRGKRQSSWQDAVNQALAEANAAISSGVQQGQTAAQSGIDTADAAIGKRQSWQDAVDQALTEANAAISSGINAANAAIDTRQSWQDVVDQALANANAAVAQAQADGAAGVVAAQEAVEEARKTAAAAVVGAGS